MIIVEGTDLVGKTTLCKKIVKYLNEKADAYLKAPITDMRDWGRDKEAQLEWQYAHMTAHNTNFDFHWGYISRIHPRNVQDRFHLSELAYTHANGIIHRNFIHPRIDDVERSCLEAKLDAIGCLQIVILCKDPDLLRQRYIDSGRAEMFDINVVLEASDYFNSNINYDQTTAIDYYTDKARPWILDEDWQEWVNIYFDAQIKIARMNSRKPH